MHLVTAYGRISNRISSTQTFQERGRNKAESAWIRNMNKVLSRARSSSSAAPRAFAAVLNKGTDRVAQEAPMPLLQTDEEMQS